ncbi:MAG: hypothetical protein FWC21_03775 [Treponema sp.]|nr:hypothetical protein [Treponema sp.]
MKKLGITLLVVLMTVSIIAVLAGCNNKPVPHSGYNYRTTGHFADWGSNFDSRFMMENVAPNDSRIAPLKNALSNAANIYLWEYNTASVANAGWSVEYSGRNISQDGKFAVKFIRLIADSTESSGWLFDMWVPSAEAGGIANLSPDTLYTPMNRSDEARDAAGDGLGSNNDNPVLLGGNGTYYIIFAVMKDNTRAMGAIKR